MYTMKKNKYTIVMFLGILVALLVFMLLISFKEGLEGNCKFFKYLGPPSKNPKDSMGLKKNENFRDTFIKKYNDSTKALGSTFTFEIKNYEVLINQCTSQELDDYRTNGKFELNTYIDNHLKQNKKIVIPPPYNAGNINVSLPVRLIYSLIVLPTNDPTITQDVKDIFAGTTSECISADGKYIKISDQPSSQPSNQPSSQNSSSSPLESGSATVSATGSSTKTGNTPIITNQAGGFVTISAEDAKTWDAACKTLR